MLFVIQERREEYGVRLKMLVNRRVPMDNYGSEILEKSNVK